MTEALALSSADRDTNSMIAFPGTIVNLRISNHILVTPTAECVARLLLCARMELKADHIAMYSDIVRGDTAVSMVFVVKRNKSRVPRELIWRENVII